MSAKDGKTLIEFNVKNGKYAIKKDGSWQINPLTWLTSFSKEKDLGTSDIYGDGEKILTLVNDKGFTGVLGMAAQDEEYNKALGFAIETDSGLAEVQQKSVVSHAIYFETEFAGADGISKTKKVWVFGVETQAPSDAYEQTTDNINNSTVDYTITIKGVNLLAAQGTADYIDENGNTRRIYTVSRKPGQVGYDTFEQSVPSPRITSVTSPKITD